MLIAVLAIGGTILGATTIAGFLMTYQIRQASDLANSAKSVFTADAGTQWALYRFFVNSSTPIFVPSNGTTATVTCYDIDNATVTCGDLTADHAISKGAAGQTARAFQVNFSR